MTEPLSILYLIGSLDVGGAEMQVLHLVRGLHGRGCRCRLFVLQSGGPLAHAFSRLGVAVSSGGMQAGDLRTKPWKLLPAAHRLQRCIRRTGPDIIHAFLPLMTFLGAAAGRLCGAGGIVTGKRALGTHQDRYPFLRPLDMLADSMSHVITVNSRAVLADTVRRDRVNASRLHLIYNGVMPAGGRTVEEKRRIRNKLKLDEKDAVVLTVANLIDYKGHADLLQAAKQVIDRGAHTCFLLVGEDRGMQARLTHQARSLGVASFLRFLGRREDLDDLYAVSDLAVLPSHEEGFSNVILEAMAAGLPVVATAVGGNPEAVVDGVTGWLVPPRQPGALAAGILDFIGDPERAARWGQRGRLRALSLFSMEKMIREHRRLYAHLASRHGRKNQTGRR
jgi:glycosyltransferase involved in cell wall biosynthesis